MVSGGGFVLDWVIFVLLLTLGIVPFLSNLFSSVIALVTVYFANTKFVFAARQNLTSLLVFLAWHLTMIFIFSLLLSVLSTTTGLHPAVTKVVLVPLSFFVNFYFGRLLFSKRR